MKRNKQLVRLLLGLYRAMANTVKGVLPGNILAVFRPLVKTKVFEVRKMNKSIVKRFAVLVAAVLLMASPASAAIFKSDPTIEKALIAIVILLVALFPIVIGNDLFNSGATHFFKPSATGTRTEQAENEAGFMEDVVRAVKNRIFILIIIGIFSVALFGLKLGEILGIFG